MRSFNVHLSSISDVKVFVNAASLQNYDIDVISGRYTIDAKSIMGIFSLDLSKPITVELHGAEDNGDAFYNSIKGFVVE